MSGVRVVRAYRQELFEIERFRRANEEYVHRNKRLIRVHEMYFPSMGEQSDERGEPIKHPLVAELCGEFQEGRYSMRRRLQ